MRYFHRTSIPPDEVMAAADAFLGARLAAETHDARRRSFSGPIGTITITAAPEGGHYTLVTAVTDQVAESEADKLAKRFLGTVHSRAEPGHQLRGAY